MNGTASGTGRSDSLRANTVAQTFPLVATYVAYLVCTPVMLARLGTSGFGIWAVASGIAQYSALFDFGISRSVLRFVSLHYANGDSKAEKRVVGAALIAISLSSAVLAVLLCVLADWFGRKFSLSSSAARVVLLCSLVIACTLLASRVVASAAFGRGRMVAMNYVLAISVSFWQFSGVLFLLVSGRPSLVGFAMWSCIGSVCSLVVTFMLFVSIEKRIPMSIPRLSDVPDLLKFGVQAQIVSAADMLVFQVAKIVLGILVGAWAAAAYEIGARVATGARAFGVLAGTAVTPKLTKVFATEGLPEVRNYYKSYGGKLTAASGLALAVAGSGSIALLNCWLTVVPPYTCLIAIMLCVLFLVNVSTSTATVTAYAIGRPGPVAVSAVVTLVISVGTMIPLVIKWGVWGCLISTTIAVLMGSFVGPYLVGRIIGVRVILYIRSVCGPICVGLVSIIPGPVVWLLSRPDDRFVAGLVLLVSMSISLCLYLGLSRAFAFLPELQIVDTLRSLVPVVGSKGSSGRKESDVGC